MTTPSSRRLFPRARRLDDIVGFGIDQVAAGAGHPPGDRPVLRLENLGTDLPLPPEAVEVTRAEAGRC